MTDRELLVAAKAGRPDARADLVERYRPPVISTARIYRRAPGIGREELVQEGVVGLLRALEHYDLALLTPFWGYAAWWVRQGMQRLVSELCGPVVLSDRAVRELARVRDARTALVRRDHVEPTSAALARRTHLPCEQVDALLAAERVPRSLDQSLDGDPAGPCPCELLEDPGASDAFDEALTHVDAERVPDLLGMLTDRERQVVSRHYGVGCEARTLREIARRLHFTAERARQIEVGAIRKMRAGV